MAGMWLAVNVPRRLGRVILANTSAKLGPASLWNDRIKAVQSRGMAVVTDIVLDRWFTPTFRSSSPAVVEACREMLLSTPIDGYVASCAAVRDMNQSETVNKIDNPTLVIIGQKDPSTPPAHGEFIASRIAGAKTVALSAAHLSNIEAASAFNNAVLNFLND
jgi:3-oxoadipate enol-lactonase